MEQRVKCLLSGCVHNDCNLLWSCYQFLVNLITLSKQVKSWNLVRTGQYSLGTTSRHELDIKKQLQRNLDWSFYSTHCILNVCKISAILLKPHCVKIWSLQRFSVCLYFLYMFVVPVPKLTSHQFITHAEARLWCNFRDHSVYVPSQWEMALQCNAISH